MVEVDLLVDRQHTGRLSRAQVRHGFTYGLDAPEALSLTMPLRLESYIYERGLHPLFQMNLPEGYLRQAIERAAAKHCGGDDISLLRLLGNHQIGRLRYTSAGQPLPEDSLTPPSLHELLNSDDAQLFSQLLERYALHSGISGVQPKVLMDIRDAEPHRSLDRPATIANKLTPPLKKYIVKTWGPEFPELACNEFLCLTLARNAGLTTANFYLSANGKLLVCERFDIGEDNQPLGFEDFCVLQGKTTQAKYDSSIEACANTIRTYISPDLQAQALQDFFKLTVLNIKIQNGDAHLKNFGIVYNNLANYRDGQTPVASRQFSPVYDLVSTTPYIANDSMALTLNGSKRWPKRKLLEKFGREHCRLSSKKMDAVFSDIDNACALGYSLAEQLINSYPDFSPIGEKIIHLLQQRIA